MELNFIDKIVNFVSPVQGIRRQRARAMMASVSNYTSASRERRSIKMWNTNSNDADRAMEFDLDTLRERSHDLLRNSPLACGIVGNAVTNIVGTGLKLQSRIDRSVLNMNDEAASAWESTAEREFNLWSESQDCDIARTLNFCGVQNLVLREVFAGGDAIVVLATVKSTVSMPYQTRLQVIEASRLSNKKGIKNGDTEGGNYLFEGVEKDRNGAPVKYHISNGFPNSVRSTAEDWREIPAFRTSTGLRNVIHLFFMTRPGQSRGIPFLSPVIESIRQITRYTEAEIDAAVIAGMFTVFIKTEDGGNDFAPDLMNKETGAKSSDDDIKLASGAVIGLAPGEDITTANPGRPNAAFDPFVNSILRQIGVALEIPYEVLVKHFTSSYSAARAALLEAWRFFLTRRQWLADNFCQIVYEVWMYEAVVIGRIKAPGFFADPLIRKAYLGSEWIGPAQGQIDPTKEIQAARERIDSRISTISQETRALTGGDFESNIVQIKKEQQALKDAGLSAERQPGSSSIQVVQEEN